MNKTIIIWSLLSLTFLFSCEKDETRVVINEDLIPPQITSPANNYSKIIEAADSSSTLIITWDSAIYGVMFPITYTVYLDSAGRDFSEEILLGTLENNDSLVLNIMSLNSTLMNAATGLGLPKNVESALELRVKSTLNGEVELYSQTVNLKITPWEKVVPPPPPNAEIQLISASGDSTIIATIAASTEAGIYSAFVKIANDSVFIIKDVVTKINYGATGGTTLVVDGDPFKPSIATNRNAVDTIVKGWYYLTVDLNTNTYTFDATMWGVVGDATPNAWDGPDFVMEFNETGNYWEANLDLIVGTLKFRQNNRWTVTTNLGMGTSASLEELEYDGQTNIPIDPGGNYNIKLYVDDLRCTITPN